MNRPPEPILHATLATLHDATVARRNWTLRKDVPVQMVNDLMEAYERERFVELFSTFDWCGVGDHPFWYKAPSYA